MRFLERFDRWVEDGPFTAADLGIYRIVYAVSALLVAPDVTWLANYPDFMFHAPPGPLRLLSGFPSPTALIVLEVLRTVVLILLGLGLWTRYASIAASVMLAVTYGLTYCLGKVDHTILLVLAPLVLAFANWGDRFSLDSLRHPRAPSRQRQWPLRLWALVIGWGFFVAALTKLLTGWLSFSSQAARGYFVLGYLTEDRTHWLAQWVAAHDIRPGWEILDWVTVVFEFAILLALPRWRAFRITLAIATTFHLGVLLIMDINFSHTVVAYGAFVSWAAIARRAASWKFVRPVASFVERRRRSFGNLPVYVLSVLAGAVIGVGAWLVMISTVDATDNVAAVVIVVVGAVIGVTYLSGQIELGLRVRARRSGDVAV